MIRILMSFAFLILAVVLLHASLDGVKEFSYMLFAMTYYPCCMFMGTLLQAVINSEHKKILEKNERGTYVRKY